MEKIPDIIDNRNVLLADEIKKLLKQTKIAKIASGYFYISGFNLLKDDVQQVEKIKIIMGQETNRPTADELILGHKEKENIVKAMMNDLEKIDKEQAKKLKDLHDLIREEKIEVKIYAKEKFHSKAYIFELKDDVVDVGIVGSSNFTLSGLTHNTELNSVHTQKSAIELLNKWFDERWNDAEDFKEDLLKIIENSEAYKAFLKESSYFYVSPLEFFKILIKILGIENIIAKDNILLPFQVYDYLKAKKKIEDYGGVLLTSSVGLGKSFVASKLLQDYTKEGKKVLLIASPTLENQWNQYLKLNKVDISKIEFLSMYMLTSKNFKVSDYNDFDIVLIDEVHNFRNPNSKRYRKIMEVNKSLYQKKGNAVKYILLTATPINNALSDMKSIIDIMHRESNFKKDNLIEDYNNLKNCIKKQSKKIPLEDSERKQLKELRKRLFVWTTRRDLKELFNGEIEIKGRKIKLKEPSLAPHEYGFSGEAYLKIYEGIVDFLKNLHMPHLVIYDPYKRYSKREQYLPALHKIQLYKRLDSSIFAFYKSLQNLKDSELYLQNDLQSKNLNEVNERLEETWEKIKSRYETDEDSDIAKIDFEDIRVSESERNEYLKQIKEDLSHIENFIGLVEKLILEECEYTPSKKDRELKKGSFRDDKLDMLKRFINTHLDKKILLFSQYKDTIDYLFVNLLDINKIKITGKTENKMYNLEKFKKDDGIRLLLSTDAMSEGVNIPEADFVINYDLPWNPVRLIQRIGRVDRLDNEKNIYVHNFIPKPEFDKELNLIKILKEKIDTIIEIIGTEYCILTEEELEKIRKKGEEDIDILKEKLDFIKKNETDKFEEKSEWKGNDLFVNLFKVIQEHKIDKKSIEETVIPKKTYYTILEGKKDSLVFFYKLGFLERFIGSIRYMTKESGAYKEDVFPSEFKLSNYKDLTMEEIENVDAFINVKLSEMSKSLKSQQDLTGIESLNQKKSKIKHFVWKSLESLKSIDKEKSSVIRTILSEFDKVEVQSFHKEEIDNFFSKYVKAARNVFSDSFIEDFKNLVEKFGSSKYVNKKEISGKLESFVVMRGG